MRRRTLVAGLASSVVVGLALVAACLGSGCASAGYYLQSVQGHLALVGSTRPVDEWLADPATDPALKERLALSQRMRDFAVTELKEPDNASYRRYADLKRRAAVWNVVAAPELSLTLRTWCFMVVGCVGYRGYFDKADADRFAQQLREDGLEVSVYGVPAYSTLGALPGERFADPLLNTFIDYPEGELARLIFHELAHQVAFAAGDTEFNESFATAVEQIGSGRWLARHASEAVRADDIRVGERRREFRELTLRYRAELEKVYRSDRADSEKRAAKAALFTALRAEYGTLKQDRWGGFSGYDGWFERANNATLGVLAAYHGLVPEFLQLFDRTGRDFDRFYDEVRRVARLEAPRDRRAALVRAAGSAP